MGNINKYDLSEAEVENEYARKGYWVRGKDRNDPNAPNSKWVNTEYRHPTTGQKLEPVKAYCNRSNEDECYYLQLSDAEGRSYYYCDERQYGMVGNGGKSVNLQVAEDQAEAKKCIREGREQQTDDGLKSAEQRSTDQGIKYGGIKRV